MLTTLRGLSTVNNFLIDGEGPFTSLYNSSQVAGAIEQQRFFGKIVV